MSTNSYDPTARDRELAEPYPPVVKVDSTTPEQSSDKKDVAKENAKVEGEKVKDEALDAAHNVSQTAKDRASETKDEAVTQAQDLMNRFKGDIQEFAGPQQERLAATARSVSDEVSAISRGEQPETDFIANIAGGISSQIESFASALENKDGQDLLNDVRRFAARKPGRFLAIAAGLGFVAGRIMRGAKDSDDVSTDREGLKEYVGGAQKDPQGSGLVAEGSNNEPTITTPGIEVPLETDQRVGTTDISEGDAIR